MAHHFMTPNGERVDISPGGPWLAHFLLVMALVVLLVAGVGRFHSINQLGKRLDNAYKQHDAQAVQYWHARIDLER